LNGYIDCVWIYDRKLDYLVVSRNDNISEAIKRNRTNNPINLSSDWKCIDSVSTRGNIINIDLYKRNGFSVLHITFNDIKPIGFVK
jgi:hypothetical protein